MCSDSDDHDHHGIICAESAHINVDECGAPEKFTGCKLFSLPSPEGKITVTQGLAVRRFQAEHHNQPKVISITQATELGTVYTPEEIETWQGMLINTICCFTLTARPRQCYMRSISPRRSAMMLLRMLLAGGAKRIDGRRSRNLF